MMKIDQFKEELFEKLANVTIPRGRGEMFEISAVLFSERIEDMLAYMDSNMEQLLAVNPYRVRLVRCLSSSSKLVFIDTDRGSTEDGDEIYYFYNEDTQEVASTIIKK